LRRTADVVEHGKQAGHEHAQRAGREGRDPPQALRLVVAGQGEVLFYSFEKRA